MSRLAVLGCALWLAASCGWVRGHDIPNAQVDRSTQVIVAPGRLEIAYEVSLSELTATQELRSLIEVLPGSDRRGWFETYGSVTGPMNAKGFLVAVGEEPVALEFVGVDLVVEEHPRWTFRFEASVPRSGRLRVRDTNFSTSEGTSRLAIKGRGVVIRGDSLPGDVASIVARPVWQLSVVEERRTREVTVDYAAEAAPVSAPLARSEPVRQRRLEVSRLSRLLDDTARVPTIWLGLLAFGLGMVHAVQPGHGKSLVAASVFSEGGAWVKGALLAIVTTLTHTGSVFLIAALLWWSETRQFGAIHLTLCRTAGFVIAAIGCWRLGRHFAGESAVPEHRHHSGSVIGLGAAAGLVPCWDAVGLVVVSEAIGRLALGLVLVVAFGLGMGMVLIAVAWLSARLRTRLARAGGSDRWERRLGLASGLVLCAIGVYLLRI